CDGRVDAGARHAGDRRPQPRPGRAGRGGRQPAQAPEARPARLSDGARVVTSDAQARRLLALLVDEAIETEPMAEVRADLAALGLDPARAIALARRLATGATASPAVALLDKVAVAEDD